MDGCETNTQLEDCTVAIATSVMDRALPSLHANRRDILIAMKAYLDGSGKKESEFLVIAGVAADDRTWARFDDQWKGVLADREIKPMYLHMQELGTLAKEFSADHGWTDGLAEKLVTDCLMYVQTLDKQRFRTFLCSVDMDAYRSLLADGSLLPDCHELCVYFSPQRILTWYIEKLNGSTDRRPPEELHYYFDQNENFKGRFERRWIQGKKSSGRIFNPWHLVKTVTTVYMRDTPGVQLADLLAWAYHRKLMAEKHGTSKKYKSLSTIAEKILPSDRKQIGAHDLPLISICSERFPEILRDRGFPDAQRTIKP